MFQVRFHGRGGQGVVTAAELLASAAFGGHVVLPDRRQADPDPRADLFAGLGRDGYMLVNSARGFGELSLGGFARGFRRDRLLVVPASSLAMAHLGRPLPGAALLGGFAALTWAVSLDAVLAAINESFTGKVAEGNAAAARVAFDFVRDEREALTEAAIS
jgi:pyruvate ferredoxin oxidoreductase gamma subunit